MLLLQLKKVEDTGEIIEEKRIKEIKSNFLGKYVYFAILILILLIVVIFYFVSDKILLSVTPCVNQR